MKKSVTQLQDKVMADYVRPSRLGREQKPVRSSPSQKRSALVGAITLFAIVAGAGWYWGSHGLGRGSSDKTEPAIAQASHALPFENKEEPAATVNRASTQAQAPAAPAPAGSVSVPEESPPAIAAVSPTQVTAPAATSPAPSLPPADHAESKPTAPNWQARINEFVQQFVESDSSGDVERELSSYAASAEILNEGEKNHDRIRHDIQSDHDRWPIRRNNIRGEIRLAEIVPNQEYTAAFEQDYHDENPARGKSVNGGVAVDVTIKMIDGSPKISSIKHKPLPKGNGSTPMPAPRTPVQESPTSPSPLASTAFVQGPQHLVRIVNKAYGFSTLVPADVFPDAARPSDIDRTSFSSASGRTTLNLLVRENSDGETFKKLYQEWIAEHTAERPNKKVHYKVFRDTWFVASGIDGQRGERGFYVKAVNKGNNIVMMSLEYDENASPLTNQTLLKMVQAFNGN
ncbi:MAG TPA: hypothetical protein VGQ95_12820 [Chthoniobacterales bacterium]|nr:hypothetical protein [Chthoniobacterales bacterium]